VKTLAALSRCETVSSASEDWVCLSWEPEIDKPTKTSQPASRAHPGQVLGYGVNANQRNSASVAPRSDAATLQRPTSLVSSSIHYERASSAPVCNTTPTWGRRTQRYQCTDYSHDVSTLCWTCCPRSDLVSSNSVTAGPNVRNGSVFGKSF